MEYQDYLKVAEALAKEAGALCLEIQQNLGDVKYKSKKDVVTRADIASEKLIVEGLRKAFPRTFDSYRRSGRYRGDRSAFPLDYRSGGRYGEL